MMTTTMGSVAVTATETFSPVEEIGAKEEATIITFLLAQNLALLTQQQPLRGMVASLT